MQRRTNLKQKLNPSKADEENGEPNIKAKSQSRKRKTADLKNKTLEINATAGHQKRGHSIANSGNHTGRANRTLGNQGGPGAQRESLQSEGSQLQGQTEERIPRLTQSANRFRIAMPTQTPVDVSGRYWNRISNQINKDTVNLQQRLAQQRLSQQNSSQTNLLQVYTAQSKAGGFVGANFQQPAHTLQVGATSSEKDLLARMNATPGASSSLNRKEFDSFQKPFSFLANLGGRQTSTAMLTTQIQQQHQLVAQKAAGQQQYQKGETIDNSNISTTVKHVFETSYAKPPIPVPSVAAGKTIVDMGEQQDRSAQITIYTNMNVDKHDFDIKERRMNQQRATSAVQKPPNTYRSSAAPAGRNIAAQTQMAKVSQRPISGMIPPSMSQKALGVEGQQSQKQLEDVIENIKQKQKDFKINKRPFSANPKYMQLAGFSRPFSAQVKMGEVQKGAGNVKYEHDNFVSEGSDEEDDSDVGFEEVNVKSVPDDRVVSSGGTQYDYETFSHRIMNSRPTTAYRKDKNFDLPYPELFDRSERTFAATFAKYGDLSYYTPVQRIGSYMNFSARLKTRHLMDLIAYMKTSKATIKPQEEEQNEAEMANQDYIDSCLFIGVMPEEVNPADLDEEQRARHDALMEEKKARVYDVGEAQFEGSFQYQKVWSETLMNQVQLSVHRFLSYIESKDAIKNVEISKYKKEWMSHALDHLPERLLSSFPDHIRRLFSEVFGVYARAMKWSIMEYILRSPDERKRLHILMLPRPVPTASVRVALAGGYNSMVYEGQHQRKVEAQNEIKLRLLNNNIVTSALHSWFRDFRAVGLVELKNLGELCQELNAQMGDESQYTMDFETFWSFQESFRQKVVQYMQYIWHRGCMMIIKRFKYMRFREDQLKLQEGCASSGKWTFSGFKPHLDASVAPIPEWKQDQMSGFERQPRQTKYQQYCHRTGWLHGNVGLPYFETEQGMELNAIPEDYRVGTELEDLVDVRENSAYIAFVSMIGGYVNFEENGYDILAKEYKRELKYVGGNMMKIQLRQVVDRSVSTLQNFFHGFITFEKLKKVIGMKPLRIIRPLITQSRRRQGKEERKDAKEENVNAHLAAQMERRKRQVKSKETEEAEQLLNQFDSDPVLSFPDYMDFQDFVNPIMRLDLTLETSHSGIQSLPQGDRLCFVRSEQDLLADFELFFDQLVCSFNEFKRPEFCKVRVVSAKRYEEDLEEEVRQKKMSIQIKKTTGQFKSSSMNLGMSPLNKSGNQSLLASALAGNQGRIKDFDQILFKGSEDGKDVFKKFLGRIQVKESERNTKDLIDENNLGIFPKPYVDKRMQIASPHEPVYQLAKEQIIKVFKRHMKESRRAMELFKQFEPVISGSLFQKVNDFLREDRREREYEVLLKELNYYEKLSYQLPNVVFFPMFEVGITIVKNEVNRRACMLRTEVLRKFESALATRSQQICDKYTQICKHLDKQLKTPFDVVEMERYKGNLLLELGQLQERLFENRTSAFFLLKSEKMFEEETWGLLRELYFWPGKLNTHMDVCDDRHRTERYGIEDAVVKKKNNFEKESQALDELVAEVSQWSDLYTYRMVIDKIVDFQAQIDSFEDRLNEIANEEMMLFGYKSPFDTFFKVKKVFTPFYELWTNVNEIMVKKRTWMECPLNQIDPDEVDTMIKQSLKTLQKLQRHLSENQLAQKVLYTMGQEIGDLNEWLPTIEVLCNPSLKDRHWTIIKKVAKANFNHKEASLTEIKYCNIKEYLDQLAEVSEKAKKESRLEKMLDKMELEWKDLRFELTTFRETGIAILQGQNVEEIQQLLDEHTMTAQTIRSSPDVAPLEERAITWERQMNFLQEGLRVWVKVQSNYLYLEPIFHSEDIIKKLPDQAMEFYRVDKIWKDIMARVQQDTLVLHLQRIKGIQTNLDEADVTLEKIQKSLNEYLDSKRQFFPRFYFLSNEDLLEILGDSKNPHKVQRHLKKCFEGVNEIVFKGAEDEMNEGQQVLTDEIIAMLSKEGEKVDLVKSIYPHDHKGNVESWLLELETQMKASMRSVVSKSYQDFSRLRDKRSHWIQNWQGQVVLTVNQIYWTYFIEQALASQNPKSMSEYFNKCKGQLEEIVAMVRHELPALLRLTLGSLIVIDVHQRDVLESLIQNGITSKNDFDWLAQLRYYFLLGNKQVQVRMITTCLDYQYEYLGNTGRLVLTPLTDRCYRTLMSALHLNLGGAPEGPAGTGKTETTKDLAKALAVHCMVFNCAEGLNAKAMAKFFKGLASAGSWSCFDEFNRIELEVLSVVAQQILEIQRAKNQQKEVFRFDDSDICLKESCNIFITMNPGYAGRSELPDNLKALFRPVAMMIPDYCMIAEISLYSFGFLDSPALAKKVVATYKLCSEQLSSQHHYDYGMRAVKAVLTSAKNLKQKFGEQVAEDVLVLRSISDANLPKFLAQDIPLFQAITEDLFQGIELAEVTYGSLDQCVRKVLQEMNLQEIKSFIEKVYQLYEMINTRHGLMLVGPTYGAKTTCYRVLAKAITYVAKYDPAVGELPVDYYVLNPKSITLSQLYGSFDPISHDFADGVLGQIFRRCAYKDVGTSRRWIVFDGPVDAEWIENMNTVLDDNKKLCLMNGEIIMMNDQMNLIFETHDLSQASPATVSRCGMVYLQPENLGWTSLVQSWIEKIKGRTRGSQGEMLDPIFIKRIEDLFDIFFGQAYTFTRKKCVTYVPIGEVQLSVSLMKIFESLLTNPEFLDFCYNPKIKVEDVNNKIDMYFLFALVWSVGAVSDEHGQKNFSQFLRKITADVYKLKNNKNFRLDKTTQIPDGGFIVHNYFIEDQRWVSWKEVLEKQDYMQNFDPSLTFHELIIPTTENLKNSYILNMCIKNSLPLLFVGPTGTGKSVSVQKNLRALPYENFTTVFVCFSAKTSAHQTQEIIDGKLEKRGRKILGPPLGKKCIIFVDDLNMPAVEQYGAQPPIELLRQWMDHAGWYEHKEKEKQFKQLIDLVFVAAMGPPGGGKNEVTPRYLRHFNIVAINNFDEAVLQRIFTKLMEWHIKRDNFGTSDITRSLKMVINGAVDIFLFAQSELRPTPAKSHYLFNLRDLSRVVQGIQMVKKEQLQDPKKVLRLWVHEVGRVFSDRLISDEDQQILYQRLFSTCRDKVREDLTGGFKSVMDEGFFKHEGKEVLTKHLIFTDILDNGISSGDRNYDEVLLSQKGQLTEKIVGFLEDFNSVSKKPMGLVMFDFAIMHTLRISRVLRMARGNSFLIGVGGSGRDSFAKLATFICDFDLVEIEQSKNYNLDQWKEDMKRLLLLAGQDSKNSVFIVNDTQLKYSFMLEDINNLLNSGEIPNLFPQDETLQIVEKLRPQTKKEGRMDLYNNGTVEQFQDYFIEKTKMHLHIILAMSPIGPVLRERIRNFPSLVNCCTINWFTVWPEEALEAVADKFLRAEEGEPEEFSESEKTSLIKMCKKIHTDMLALSEKYFEEQKRFNYVTPTSYLELLQTYKTLLKKVRSKTLFLKDGYEKGIEKLLQTQDEVQKMQIDLSEKQPRLAEMTLETDALMLKIQKESKEVVEPKKIQIQEEEVIANQQAQEAQTIKIECDNDLKKALPLVKKAQDALNTLEPADINEIRALGKPPNAIRKVLHAVCIMCQRKVEKTPKKDNPKELEENWWFTSQKFMKESDFLDQLLSFDKDHIPDNVISKIRTQFITDPDFKPSRVEKASVAAKGLCLWVKALDEYDKVAKLIAPKRARAKEAELKYKDTLNSLRIKQEELQEIVGKFEMLQAELEEAARKKQKLQEDIEDCSKKLERAQTLLQGLGGEQKRWQEQVVVLGKQHKNLTGDSLLSAAIVCYLGIFTSEYRSATLKQWLFDLNSLRINASGSFSLQQTLGEPVTIRHWNLNGLPQDNFSIDNGIVVFNTRRWPLMIDPQSQANKWIKNLEMPQNQQQGSKLNIVKLSDSDFVRVLEQCVQLGQPVLLENVGETLDPILEPILLKQTFKSAGVISIKLGENIIEYCSDFRLYMTTKHANPHYLPELSTKVTLINFMITFDGLKEQLLNLVVQKENPMLDEQRSKLIVQSYENKKKLKEIENSILDVLRSSKGNILGDEKAIDVLKQSQILSQDIKEKQETAEETEKKLEEARKLYLPIAYHSSLLFFIIQKLSNIDVMYQYSLSWFIQLFLLAIENSERSEFIDQRLDSLKDFFTLSIYSNVCRSLFEQHKLLFSFILVAKIQEAEGLISSHQYEFIISTQPGLENPLSMENKGEQWLPAKVWNRFCELARCEHKLKQLATDFAENERLWKKIYESANPLKEAFPQLQFEGQSVDMALFTKLCVIKVLRPDKMIAAVKEFIHKEKGEAFLNPPPFDLELSYNDSSFFTPLIFVLPGSDPLQSLTTFAQHKKKLDSMRSISLGQDQGPKAEQAIEEAKHKGGWVLLQNCHLYPSWMPKLEKICEQLEMKVHGKDAAHPGFRLWLSSYTNKDFPILILQNGVKMTNEPPKGLKANMIGSFKLEPVSDPGFFNIHPKQETFKKMLYGLCMFHAIIQERRNYGALGWNIRYDFTVSDLQISAKQLHNFVAQYSEVPFNALKYLTGQCNYGGRVTDVNDAKILQSLLSDFYNPDILNAGFKPFGLDDYTFPEGNLNQQRYLDHIYKMPFEEPPELFGFHPNANITKDLKETDELCYDLLKMGEVEGVKQKDQGKQLVNKSTKEMVEMQKQNQNKPELVIEKICKEILAKLPALFDIEAVQEKYPVIRENSMNTVLVQELTRFNKLLKVITESLKNILLALKGEVLLSESLEQVFNSLLIGEIPQLWLKNSYPSLKPVASYIKDFCNRLATFQQWINNGAPKVFWLSGFFFTQSFLTGILQNYARRYQVEIDTLVFDFKFMQEDPTDYDNEIYKKEKTPDIVQPEDGAYISGLFLEGARWDYNSKHLKESLPKVLFSKVPIIWLSPIRSAKLNESHIFECPVYKTQERKGVLSTTGHSTNFVLYVRTPINEEDLPEHWVKRGVAMICSLSH